MMPKSHQLKVFYNPQKQFKVNSEQGQILTIFFMFGGSISPHWNVLFLLEARCYSDDILGWYIYLQ